MNKQKNIYYSTAFFRFIPLLKCLSDVCLSIVLIGFGWVFEPAGKVKNDVIFSQYLWVNF
jgi:hypothetical protein